MTKNEFCKKWLDTFASGISKKELKKCIFDYKYIWHVFSFELIAKNKFLVGDNAREAFKKKNKYSNDNITPIAEILYFFSDNDTTSINSTCDTVEKLEEQMEVYVVDKNFKWTYIVTHENGCGLGPYFMEIKD